MELRFDPSQLGHVPIVYWPWVWWQLLWLRFALESEGSEAIWSVTATGRVVVHLISDPDYDLVSWFERFSATTPLYGQAVCNPSGEAHLCAVHYWVGRLCLIARKRRAVPAWPGCMPLPSLQDSS